MAGKTGQKLAFRGGDVALWQQKVRKKLGKLLGIDVVEKAGRGGLNVRSLWKREHEPGTIEKIVFSSQPHADVPAYVCLPSGAQPPYMFFICLQGHMTGMHDSLALARDEVTPMPPAVPDDDFALGCMRRGIAALCIEQRSLGERVEKIIPQHLDYPCHQAAMHALMLGTTLLAERIFDVDRAIDYLQSRGDADMDRVGCMGNSGGGTTSLFAGAMLERLRFVMPSCYFSSFDASLLSVFHCVCNYVPGLYRHVEMSDIAGLIAPRTLVLVNGARDELFPIDATREQFGKLRAIYKALDAEDRCHLVEGPEGHRFYADLAWPVMQARFSRPPQ